MKVLKLIVLLCLGTVGFAQNFGIQFDGQDDGIPLCDDDAFDIGDGFTIEAWIFTTQWKAEAWQGSILNKDQQGPDSGFAFRAGKNGTLSFVMSADQIWNEVQSGEIMNTNQWYHVAIVVDGTTMSLFINGELVNSNNYEGTPTPNDQTATIGASPGFPGRVWDGILDEIRVWNVARTPAEIDENQTTEFTGNEAGLVAYLPMNEGEDLSTANLANTNCSGSFSNMGADAWQDGYSIPQFDVGVISIDGPDVLSLYRRPVKVSLTIKNLGSDPISNVPVKLDVNGLPALEENYEGTLQPGEEVAFSFTTPLDLSDNNTNLLSASTDHPDDANALNDGVSYRYKKPDDDRIVNILNEEQHNFGSAGQTQFTLVNLPENMEDFGQILLHFSVECPNDGCDPWDQPASFFLDAADGNSYELARFVTPFGIECGPWTVDITDFKSIMRGPAVFRSFVQVWGPSGWLVNADLEFIDVQTPTYQKVTPLWETDNWVYGDPGISHDLPEQTVTIDNTTETGHMRMTITGHGQGNTDNAAEFSNKTHTIMLNSNAADSHNLWKSDCASNPCADQNGTWEFARAGWCPGQNVIPYIYNLTDEITPGQALSIDYELEDYVNELNTGYNGSSHTEPHYRIFSYLIESGDEWFDDYNNLRAESVSVGTNGDPDNPVFESLTLNIKNTGSNSVSNANVSYFINGEFVFEETITAAIAPGETYVHDFSQVNGFTAGTDHLIFGVVSFSNDENLSDDVAKTFIDDQLTNINEIDRKAFKVFPNPSGGNFNIEFSETFFNGSLSLLDAQGRLLQDYQLGNTTAMDLQIADRGIYILKLTSPEGDTLIQKLIVQ